MDVYDLIVIGTGTAEQVTASHVRKAGRSDSAVPAPFAAAIPRRCWSAGPRLSTSRAACEITA